MGRGLVGVIHPPRAVGSRRPASGCHGGLRRLPGANVTGPSAVPPRCSRTERSGRLRTPRQPPFRGLRAGPRPCPGRGWARPRSGPPASDQARCKRSSRISAAAATTSAAGPSVTTAMHRSADSSSSGSHSSIWRPTVPASASEIRCGSVARRAARSASTDAGARHSIHTAGSVGPRAAANARRSAAKRNVASTTHQVAGLHEPPRQAAQCVVRPAVDLVCVRAGWGACSGIDAEQLLADDVGGDDGRAGAFREGRGQRRLPARRDAAYDGDVPEADAPAEGVGQVQELGGVGSAAGGVGELDLAGPNQRDLGVERALRAEEAKECVVARIAPGLPVGGHQRRVRAARRGAPGRSPGTQDPARRPCSRSPGSNSTQSTTSMPCSSTTCSARRSP